MKQFHFSIRTILLVSIGVLNLLIAVPLGYMMVRSVVVYNESQHIREATDILNSLYDIKKHLSLERAASLSISYLPEGSRAILSLELKESRKQADESFQRARAYLEQDRNPHINPLLLKVQQGYTDLEVLRSSLDQNMAASQDKRGLASGDLIFDRITVLIRSNDDLIEEYSKRFSVYDAAVGRQIRLARLVWEVSEYASREYAMLGKIIAQNKYPSDEVRDQITLWRHRTEYGLEIAHGSAVNSPWKDKILPFLEEAETHYFVIFEQVKSILENSSQSSSEPVYPMRVEMWLELAAQAVDSLHAMTDAALNVNEIYVDQTQENAERGILISLSIFLSVVVISMYCWWLINVRVIRPVNSMVNALYAETKRAHHTMPQNDNRDEIAKLSEVLEVFQENSRQLEQERDKAQAANIAKSEFLANMSHEIRTPMNVVVGLANILSRGNVQPEKQTEFIRTLQVSAESLLSLINDLLDFSKIETHNIALEKIPFNLTQVIHDVVTVVSIKAKEKNLTVTADVSQIQDREFRGDPTRIRQVLLNICGNAVKFTEKGSISIHVKCLPNTVDGYDNLLITVADTGIGIAADKKDLIFEKFTQADSTITRKYGGTGLGLSITKNLVTMMGGSISVDSTVGQGTTFSIYLPLLSRPAQNFSIPDVPANDSKMGSDSPKKILLVEDYHPNTLVVGTLLEQFGYIYDVAVNGHDALQKYMQGKYDIILMDIQMPGMDGYQTTSAIRKFEREESKAAVKIIGLTAYATSQDKERCLEVGMNDYLPKPFEPQKLHEKLRA